MVSLAQKHLEMSRNAGDFPHRSFTIKFKELFLDTQRPKVQEGVVVVDIVAEKILKQTAKLGEHAK